VTFGPEGRARDAGYDDWLDGLAAGEAHYLACPAGHGSLPPRRTCPVCGDTDLTERALPASGTVESYTVVHVPTPEFEGQAPYTSAVADFGPVRLTGLVRGENEGAGEGDGIDATPPVEVGTTVAAAVGENPTTGGRVVVLRPR
jgi:uncharacterized OB-fold protein